ncbi:hypothetical protein P3X46_033385 [Hevea brasiliensis]|uniref:Cysteine-rich receptor-like protein kinase n=1 Tax=Hevea brasiliensis TaxID=3981 RepID=A0ABQ9KGA8_HEVBR|nr:hypothetical protein P3X46_033385 [Hevea brasiliensis]
MQSFALSMTIILLVLLNIIINIEAQITSLYHWCPNTSTFTKSSIYRSNLEQLLSSLSSNAIRSNGFYNASIGQDPNDVYGLFLCRGDLSSDVCQNCVTFAVQEIIQLCPTNKVAVVWYDECFLRYSNQSIFSILATTPIIFMWNSQNTTDRLYNDSRLVATISDTASKAAFASPSSKLKYAIGEYQASPSSEILYSLSQCTPDLSSYDCYQCLQQGIGRLPGFSTGRRGARVLFPSCNIRYEFYQFYNKTPVIPSPKGGRKKATLIKVGSSLSAILGILLFSCCTYTLWKRKSKKKEWKENIQELQSLVFGRETIGDDDQKVQSNDFHLIRLDILHKATEHFSEENKLGQGGYGPVYKGTLEDGKEIAVKRLSRTSGQGLQEFMNEVTLIAKLQHRNLVRLVGCCLEKCEKLLVYEYMPNKSLDFFLFDSNKDVQLDWQRRLSTINGVARGLLYLHEDSRLRIIHRDLKTSNILLDYDMNPKISDFGMARIFGENQSEANTNRVVGTYFEVILLEIISGKKNNGFHFSEKGESLLTFAWKLWSKNQGLELMDPLIEGSSVASEVLKCIHIGLLCVQEDPADRPTMSSVVVMLASDHITLPQPTQPAFSVGRIAARLASSNQKVCSVNQVTLSNISPR